LEKIGLGGSCHWCTEAIFRSLKGVTTVEQGWIASDGDNEQPSEAVIVQFDPKKIDLQTLIAIHLHTHSCTSNHEMRGKYRSAVYTYYDEQIQPARKELEALQNEFDQPIITQVLPFQSFKLNEENYLNYYYKDPTKPFCQNIVNPKLKILLEKFGTHIAPELKPHLSAL
jgi:peptide-methionine (S)-S-oxide reductase